MLSTALVINTDIHWKGIMTRVLLDSGSQVNHITVRLAIKQSKLSNNWNGYNCN